MPCIPARTAPRRHDTTRAGRLYLFTSRTPRAPALTSVAMVLATLMALLASASAEAAVDFNNDRKTDFTVWRPSNGTWYVQYNASPTSRTQQWGQASDIPVPGDYDGDNKTDFAVWRPAEGMWYILTSNMPSEIIYQQWGQGSDIPIVDTHRQRPRR